MSGTPLTAAVEDSVELLIESDPAQATIMGDHRFDGRLPLGTVAEMRSLAGALEAALARIDAVDDVGQPVDHVVDLEIVRSRLAARLFDVRDVRRHEWDPLAWNPGWAIHPLVTRPFAPADERLESVESRLLDVPRYLADARATLGEMPRVHVETAIEQSAGFISLVAAVDSLAEGVPALQGRVRQAADTAASAVADHAAWLADREPTSQRDPRLGVRLYGGALWHGLDEEADPVRMLEDAESFLDDVTTRMRRVAARITGEPESARGVVRRALDLTARRFPVDASSLLPAMSAAMTATEEHVRERDLVSLPDVEATAVRMPEIHRGLAVAYCDAPGPLEEADVPTVVAVAPPPATWGAERIASFYREYNGMMLYDLAAHEAIPGHVLQLAHARQVRGATRARRFGHSGVFVEGWAVYAEELMVATGFAPGDDPGSADLLALQQLKMAARMALNAILDARVHGGDIDEAGALELLGLRGFQEEGEAYGKWRRALLTAAQLPTYFVGYRAVRGLVDDLAVVHPDWAARRIHDLVLAHGSIGPRHLRTLMGL